MDRIHRGNQAISQSEFPHITKTASGSRWRSETWKANASGEKIAVALVLNRYDLLEQAWGTMLASVDRLGPEWTKAALRVQRRGWED